MQMLVRHRWLVEVDAAGIPGWATVLERLGHRVYVGRSGDGGQPYATVDSTLHGRTVILHVTADEPGSRAGYPPAGRGPAAVDDPAGQLAARLATILQRAGATLVQPPPEHQPDRGAAADPFPIPVAAVEEPGAGGSRPWPAVTRLAADVLLTIHLDAVSLRARVASAGRRPWQAWKLARHLARSLWLAGCIPVHQRHWPGSVPPALQYPAQDSPAPGILARGEGAQRGAAEAAAPQEPRADGPVASAIGEPPASGSPPAVATTAAVATPWGEETGETGRETYGTRPPVGRVVLTAPLAATLILPADWPADVVAAALYAGLVTFYGGPPQPVVPWGEAGLPTPWLRTGAPATGGTTPAPLGAGAPRSARAAPATPSAGAPASRRAEPVAQAAGTVPEAGGQGTAGKGAESAEAGTAADDTESRQPAAAADSTVNGLSAFAGEPAATEAKGDGVDTQDGTSATGEGSEGEGGLPAGDEGRGEQATKDLGAAAGAPRLASRRPQPPSLQGLESLPREALPPGARTGYRFYPRPRAAGTSGRPSAAPVMPPPGAGGVPPAGGHPGFTRAASPLGPTGRGTGLAPLGSRPGMTRPLLGAARPVPAAAQPVSGAARPVPGATPGRGSGGAMRVVPSFSTGREPGSLQPFR